MPTDPAAQLSLDGFRDAPTEAQLLEIEAAAVQLAVAAGRVLMDRFRTTLEIEYKDKQRSDPVTEVDREIEGLVREAVTRDFPAHGLLGEEGSDSGPDRTDYIWIVDPLDGTSNFINGLTTFACSIGVLWRGLPVAAALFLPTSRHLEPGVYHARLGGGAHFNDQPFSFRLLDARPAARLSGLPGGTGGVTGPKGRRFGIARTLGSMAAEIAYTAEGTLQMSLLEGGKIWDVVGGVALCLEAGAAAYVRDGKSSPWRPLERFAGSDAEPPSTAQLRTWNQGLVVGAPEVLPKLVRDLTREQGPLAALRRLIMREGE